MMKLPSSARRWWCQTGRILRTIGAAAVVLYPGAEISATGYYGPAEYLSSGGRNLNASPEFYWELEMKRLAGGFHPPEKLSAEIRKARRTDGSKLTDNALDDLTADADTQDFAAALAAGSIKPADPTKATEQNETARAALTTTSETSIGVPPEEFDSEFADYHRGALAYRSGKSHWDKARSAWEKLLSRRAAERKYRSVWAAFMLGKLAMKSERYPDAIQRFQQTRQLALDGFIDSLGLAADSYGWEARSEWKQGHPEKAAPLYLTQLALGDESAVYSLKALIPDREPVDGMLNYGPEGDERGKWSAAETLADQQKTSRALQAAAADPLLRRLVTSHILATESNRSYFYGKDELARAHNRCAHWLGSLKALQGSKIQDAEYLGWIAYADGDYKAAAEWLALANSDSPAACWLRAKLQLRAGKIAEAEKSMAQGWETLRDSGRYTGWVAAPGEAEETDDAYGRNDWTFEKYASGDLGVMQLARADFTRSLDTFLNGKLWPDTAYVAERLLTADELKAYVARMPPAKVADDSEDADTKPKGLAYLLGRRLVREDRYEEARQYLPAPYDKYLEDYVGALKDGADEKLPKLQRARAWFAAAWLVRFDGMELMGTEAAPDGFISEGSFASTDIAKERLRGTYEEIRYLDGQDVKRTEDIKPKPTKQELARLQKNTIRPDIRFHYRVIAAALAMRAAQLLDDNTEELADVINRAGLWVKDRDPAAADRYFAILKKRAANTAIGHAALAKKWFVDESGPWSLDAEAAYTTSHAASEDK
jgi:hypothetical protein